VIEESGVRLRRAVDADADFLVELFAHEQVEPFLAAVRSSDPDGVRAEIQRSEREPDAFGVLVIEAEGSRAGTLTFERTNARSRIARLGGLALLPDFRGRGLAITAARLIQRYLLHDLDYHRLELEVYGFNERAIRHAERCGFVREGVRRKAYWRHGQWMDGIMFGLVREDLDERFRPDQPG
jgi:RimJ/RimL family protein N-acetyltransferase